MRCFRHFLLPCALAAAAIAVSSSFAQVAPPAAPYAPSILAPSASAKAAASDEEALKQAGLTATDTDRLIAYLEQRTLTDIDQGRVRELIRNLGADDFDARQKASREIESFGPAAIGPLKDAERDDDPEVAYRAKEAVKRLNKVRHEVVAAAAVRAVLRLKPSGAARALLGFLPVAGDEQVADEIRTALVGLAVRDGRTDPAVLAALADPLPVRRSAAYVALIEAGAADALAKVRDSIRADDDPEAKFRGLWALALVRKEKDAVPDLVRLIPRLNRGRIGQLEDLLLQVAGKDKPGVRFGRSAESLNGARDGWLTWWERKGTDFDLAKFDYRPRVLGYTDLVQMDPRGWGNWRVTTIGPDDKERWRITNLINPSDARVLPDGSVLVAEQNANQVSVRDTAGKVAVARNVAMPLTVEPLPDGGMLLGCRNEVRELDKAGKTVFAYARPGNQHDIVAARRLPTGETLYLTSTAPNNCYRLDAKGKPTGTALQVGRVHQLFAGLDVLSADKVLLTEFNRVAEYDLKTGKAGWAYAINNPTSVQRLSNGNTLIGSTASTKVIEVDETGEIVWEYQAPDGLKVLRARRR